ncbi:MAG: hypothetical protein HUU57_08115 [Bdellovibrio sp.]|nr:hypothetical protein [Bdellovibrio sp.]
MQKKPQRIFILAMLFAVLPFYNACTGGFKASTGGSSENPWSQGVSETPPESGSPNTSAGTGAPSCSVQMSTLVSQDSKFSVTATSQNISKLQISVNSSEYITLAATNGSITWAERSFPPGTYNLKFRGLTNKEASVICEPANTVVTIYSNTPTIPTAPTAPTNPTTPTESSPGGGGAAVNTNYAALTGFTSNGSFTDSGFKNFNTIYHPDKLTLRDVDAGFAPGLKCYNMQVRHHSTSLRSSSITQRYRVYIPPGTKSFDMTTMTYWDTTTKQALTLKLDSPPESTYEDALTHENFPRSPNEMRFLEYLFNGQEFRSYVGEQGNVLPRVSGGTNYSVTPQYLYQTSRGGWLYFNQIKLIGEVAMNIEIQLCVDPTVYKNWFATARWDSDGNPL